MESPTTNTIGSSSLSSSPSMPFLHRYYIFLKIHYFLFFSAFGVLYPILNITLRSRGLSNSEIAYANLLIPFILFFTNPLMGFTADHTRRYLLVFNLVLAAMTISYGMMFLLPAIKTHHIQAKMLSDEEFTGRVLDFCASQEVASKCSSRSECGCLYKSYCQKDNFFFNFTFAMSPTHTRQQVDAPLDLSAPASCGIQYQVPIDSFIADYHSKLALSYENLSALAICEITCSIPYYCQGFRYPRQTQYIFLYSILFILGANFIFNAITLGASIGFASLPRPDIFGQQRVWGTVGFGISAFVASRLYAIFQSEFVYIIMFSITTMICILFTSFIRIQPAKHKRSIPHEQEMIDLPGENLSAEREKKNLSQFKAAALIPLLKNVDVLIFLSLTFIWGMSYAVLDPYVYLYIDEIAPCYSRSIIGWMSLIDAISEILAFYSASTVIRLFGTNFTSVIIFLAFAVRFSGYYYIKRPYYILFAESMHFFNFGILYVLIAQKADSIAPPALSGTLQGVVNGVTFGLGRGIGLIASSFIYTRLQSKLLFLVFALCNLIAAAVYSICFLLCKKHLKKPVKAKSNAMIPKIVIDSVSGEPNVPDEPLLISSSSNCAENRTNAH